MSQPPEVNTINLENESPKVYAKDSWYNAYLKGGSLIPQVRFGPHLSTLRAVLTDIPNLGWQTVVESLLTNQQAARSGTVMNNLHAAAGVDLYTDTFPQTGVSERRRTITPEDLQREWHKTVLGMQQSIYGFFTDRTLPEDLPPEEATKQINALLFDPNNHAGLIELRRMVDAGCKALNETKVLAELFRLGHSNPEVRARVLAERRNLFEPYFQLYGLTDEMVATPDIILGKIVGRVQEAFVPFNNPQSHWLLYGTGLKLGT